MPSDRHLTLVPPPQPRDRSHWLGYAILLLVLVMIFLVAPRVAGGSSSHTHPSYGSECAYAEC